MSFRNERENSEINEYSSTKKTYPWYLFFLDHAFAFSFWPSIATSLQEDIQLPSPSAFMLLCSPLPRYIMTGQWDLQSMAKVMKLEGFVTEGVAASVLVSWIACSEGNPVTMLWGHSSNSGERPPHRGAEASRRQPSKLAGHARALEADPASAKPSSDGNVDSHSTVTPGETLSQNFSAKPQKVGDNKCLLLFQVIKFGFFFC